MKDRLEGFILVLCLIRITDVALYSCFRRFLTFAYGHRDSINSDVVERNIAIPVVLPARGLVRRDR